MLKKAPPRPFPISLIKDYAIDMIQNVFPDVKEPPHGFEVDSTGTTIILNAVNRSTEPFFSELFSQNEDYEGQFSVPKTNLFKNFSCEASLSFAPEAGPVQDGLAYSDYFLVVGTPKQKTGNIILYAEKQCPSLDEHNEDTWYGSILVRFFHGGNTPEQLKKRLEELRAGIMEETFGKLFQDTLTHSQDFLPAVLQKILEKIPEMDLNQETKKAVLDNLKKSVRELERTKEQVR